MYILKECKHLHIHIDLRILYLIYYTHTRGHKNLFKELITNKKRKIIEASKIFAEEKKAQHEDLLIVESIKKESQESQESR